MYRQAKPFSAENNVWITEHEYIDVKERVDMKYLFDCLFDHVFGSGYRREY
jgi:hypothetical protein